VLREKVLIVSGPLVYINAVLVSSNADLFSLPTHLHRWPRDPNRMDL